MGGAVASGLQFCLIVLRLGVRIWALAFLLRVCMLSNSYVASLRLKLMDNPLVCQYVLCDWLATSLGYILSLTKTQLPAARSLATLMTTSAMRNR